MSDKCKGCLMLKKVRELKVEEIRFVDSEEEPHYCRKCYQLELAENKRMKEALKDLRSEIDEDNCHDPETCGEVGHGSECLICIIDKALNNETNDSATDD